VFPVAWDPALAPPPRRRSPPSLRSSGSPALSVAIPEMTRLVTQRSTLQIFPRSNATFDRLRSRIVIESRGYLVALARRQDKSGRDTHGKLWKREKKERQREKEKGRRKKSCPPIGAPFLSIQSSRPSASFIDFFSPRYENSFECSARRSSSAS